MADFEDFPSTQDFSDEKLGVSSEGGLNKKKKKSGGFQSMGALLALLLGLC